MLINIYCVICLFKKQRQYSSVDVSIHLCPLFVPCHSLPAQGISLDACEGDFGGS